MTVNEAELYGKEARVTRKHPSDEETINLLEIIHTHPAPLILLSYLSIFTEL